jgi:tetratricopeptide (TPR) repeat protein
MIEISTPTVRQIAIFSICIAVGVPVAAQVAASLNPLPSGDFQNLIYIVTPVQSELGSDSQNLVQINFAATLIELKIAASSTLHIERVSTTPDCTTKESDLVAAEQDRARQSINRTIDGRIPYLTLQISAVSRPRVSNESSPSRVSDSFDGTVITFELDKITRCRPEVLATRSTSLSKSSALDTLSFIADTLSSQINTAKAIKVDVIPAAVTGTSTEDARLGNDLCDTIIGQLEQSGTYSAQDLRVGKPVSPGEYVLESRLVLTRRRSLDLFTTEIRDASVVLSISQGNQLLWEKSIQKPQAKAGDKSSRETLGSLFVDAATAAIMALNDARSSRDLNIHRDTELRGLDDQILESKVRSSLCATEANAPCKIDRDTALLLLLELERRHPTDVNRVELVAKTQFEIGKYLDAAKSFDKSISLLSSQAPETTAALYTESGDAWYRAGNFALASKRYKSALDMSAEISGQHSAELTNNEGAIRIQLARSLAFIGDRKGAFQVLLDGLAAPSVSDLNLELRALVDSMQQEELIWAASQLDSRTISLVDPNVSAAVHEELAELYLSDRSDLAKADEHLAKIEELPQEKLDQTVRANALYWRGEWNVARSNWEQAEPAFVQSLKLSDTPARRHDVGLFYFLWASEASQPQKARNSHFVLAADTVLPILQSGDVDPKGKTLVFAESESMYRNANHRIAPSKDEVTKQRYIEILRDHPDNIVVATGLMGVCTDFLHDKDCALLAATDAEKSPSFQGDLGSNLDIAEVYVQFGNYKGGLVKVQNVRTGSDHDYGAVARFYQVWASLALGDTADAVTAKEAWDKEMNQFWDRPDKDHGFRWRFEGAERMLQNDASLNQRYRTLLGQMVDTMGNQRKPLPGSVM